MLDIVLPNITNRTIQGNSAIYEIGPVDAGYAMALANALRRVLLSSLPGAAVNSFEIQGIQHEFQDIPNIKEDVTDIALNLKKLRLRSYSNHAVHIHLDVRGERNVTAADITLPSTIEVVNPDLYIATLDNEYAHLVMDMTVGTGRGFVSVEVQAEQTQTNQPIGVILIDAIYSPVLHVNFTIEHIRVGWVGALDKIILEITTDGTISPDEALRESADILRQQFAVLRDYRREEDAPTEEQTTLSTVSIPRHIYDTPIEVLGLSTRVQNSFRRYGIAKAGHVLEMDGDQLLALRNIGEKTLQEISECFKKRGFLPKL